METLIFTGLQAKADLGVTLFCGYPQAHTILLILKFCCFRSAALLFHLCN